MNESLIPNARAYASQRQLEIAESLGSGKDGIVLVAKRKAQPARIAIKVLRWSEAYEREKQVYERHSPPRPSAPSWDSAFRSWSGPMTVCACWR
jgi:hypothetical protein